MLICSAAGLGLAYWWVSEAPTEFRSSTTIEINYMRDLKGKLFLEDGPRRAEAIRLALELESVDAKLKFQQVIEASRRSLSIDSQNGVAPSRLDIRPPRTGRRPDPPYITLVAYAGDSQQAQLLAVRSAEIAADIINDRYTRELEERQRFWDEQIDETSKELKVILQEKRDIIGYESGLPELVASQLAEENSRLISELIIVLSELREESSRLYLDTGADTSALILKIAELTRKVEVVGDSWETRLKVPLEALYAIEAQPDFQFALMREDLVGNKFRNEVVQMNELFQAVTSKEQATIITSKSPEPIALLGIKRRYIYGFGGGIGILIGWLFANLGENLLGLGRSRRLERTANTGAAQPSIEDEK